MWRNVSGLMKPRVKFQSFLLQPKQCIPPKQWHTRGEAWWWQHHALGVFSSAWAGALVKVEGILSSFKHHWVLAKTVKFMLESILTFSVPKTESMHPDQQKNGLIRRRLKFWNGQARAQNWIQMKYCEVTWRKQMMQLDRFGALLQGRLGKY